MTNARFHLSDGSFVPAASSHAPWSTDMLHGRLIGGLAARAIEADLDLSPDGTDRRVARLTVDLFRPAGMTPLTVTTERVRQGRRIEVIDAFIASDGHVVARVTGVVLATSSEPPGTIWQPERSQWPDPASTELNPADADASDADQTDENGWLFRWVDGSFASAEQTRVWTNDEVPLVDDEPLSPLVRAAVSGDIACPLANAGDDGIHYINADYTMALARYPVGPWIGLEVAQQEAADGISIASCNMFDEAGLFATSGGSSITTAPLRND